MLFCQSRHIGDIIDLLRAALLHRGICRFRAFQIDINQIFCFSVQRNAHTVRIDVIILIDRSILLLIFPPAPDSEHSIAKKAGRGKRANAGRSADSPQPFKKIDSSAPASESQGYGYPGLAKHKGRYNIQNQTQNSRKGRHACRIESTTLFPVPFRGDSIV